jgi:hypothetical protein
MTRPLALLLLIASTACGTPATEVPPFGIGSVSWPTNATAAQEVFDRLPGELRGMPRDDGPPLSTSYGGGAVELWAEDMGAAECPGLLGVDLVRAALDGEVVTETVAADPQPEGVPPFLIGSRPDGTFVAAWSVPGCSWVFAVEAGSAELREAAVSELVRAAGPGAPSAETG